MNKKNKKIIIFILSIAFVGYGLFGFNLSSSGTALAYSDLNLQDTQIQTKETSCDQSSQNCTQEHMDNCSTCVIHHNCHSDYLATSLNEAFHIQKQSSFVLIDDQDFNNLNYPQESPPS